jgi:hypothetical protein
MAFDQQAMNRVEVERKANGFYFTLHFRGKTFRQTGAFTTREEAVAAGNRDLARLEVLRPPQR